jgi:hypothetical protein
MLIVSVVPMARTMLEGINMLTGFILSVLVICVGIVWYKVATLPDDVETRNNVVQVKKEMYLAMAKQRKKFETTPVKNLYSTTIKRWERS